MTRYAIFLRGVNVGGITIKSADLRETFGALAVSGVRTLLASGNVVCSSDLSPEDLKSQSERALRERFGYHAWVVVLEAGAVESIIAGCPFPADDAATHTYLTLFSDPAVLAEFVHFARSVNEPVHPLGTIAAAWQAPKGGTLESPLNAFSNRTRFKRATTTRNIRTLEKVLGALRS
jgi:uncharacterized protein (DUF1697 family)